MLKLTTLADGVQWVFQEPTPLPPWLTTATDKYKTLLRNTVWVYRCKCFNRSVCIGANAQLDMAWQMFLQDPLDAIGT